MLITILNYLFHSYLEVAVKKLFILSVFLFIPIIALLFVQCSESTIDSNDQALPLYSPGGGVEIALNNLSFPGILADNYTITPIAATRFEVIYPDESLLTEEQKAYDWYAQKEDGNVWQADFAYTDGVDVSFIDWGDNIESFSPTQGKPFRLEVTLYKNLDVPMTGYEMALLANPSSPDEVQGTYTKTTIIEELDENGDPVLDENGVPVTTTDIVAGTYPGDVATIASDKAILAVQHYGDDVDASTLTWNGSSWNGADDLEPVVFGVELNVAGKLIYGAAKKGWKPDQTGKYRITYYLLEGSEVNISEDTYIGPAPTDQVATPVVDASKNITYVDIVVLPRSGGKK